MHTAFRGLIAAPFTPFNNDRSLNPAAIPAYAALLRANGVGAAFVCGTTGEGLSLTVAERIRVAEEWMRVSDAALRIIVHVGHTALDDARALAAHAARIGAAAIGAMAPCFFKPRDADELVAWCEALAAAAPDVPFYYYHIPSMTGVTLPMVDFLARADGRIPSLAGIKYTHEDLDDYEACVQYSGGRYEILFGRDELLLEGWARQALGAVGSTYNYAAPLYRRLIEATERHDLARARLLQDQAIRMIKACNGVGVTHLAASKAIMALLGVDCGPVRLPLRQPDAAQLALLRENLESIGFSDFACRPPAPTA
ncbi:MAG TPA: dihydrodipicolinate synthase family protein [Opitutaceae bacterium]